MVDAVAVLQSTADVTGVAMEVDESRNAASLLLGMSNEVGVQRDFIFGLYVHDFERKTVDLRRRNTRSMRSDVGVEEQIVLNRIKQR